MIADFQDISKFSAMLAKLHHDSMLDREALKFRVTHYDA